MEARGDLTIQHDRQKDSKGSDLVRIILVPGPDSRQLPVIVTHGSRGIEGPERRENERTRSTDKPKLIALYRKVRSCS
jgi:hypothetical protein